MKNLKYIASALFTLSVVFSCQRELEIAPTQGVTTETAVSTPEGVQNILVGAYALMGSSDMSGGDAQIFADLLGNSGQMYWYGTYQDLRQINRKSILVDNSYIRDTWKIAYQTIFQTNVILEHLNVFTDSDERNRVEGEARFLRGMSYFELVRLFGKQYVAGTNNSQLGVPIVLSGNLDINANLSVPRNTVEEVYTQVLADLQQAADKLPTTNGYYADRYSAEALLARVYLQKQDYANARNRANDVIENGGKSLMAKYADAFNTTSNTNEDIFANQISARTDMNSLITFYADDAHGGRGGDIAISQDYYYLFETDDARGSFYYLNSDDDMLTKKYTNQYGNVHVIRLAEMYLIRAEANLMLGSNVGNEPVDDVNIIRARAGASALTTVTRNDILTERQMELGFEGFLIHDIRRSGGMVGSLNWDDDALVFPIPLREIQVNPKLVQNPGY